MHTMYQVRVQPRAQADIEDLQTWIANDHPIAAIEFTSALLEKIETLRLMPRRYPVATESRVLRAQVRAMPFPPYRVLYRIAKSTVLILRVRHAARRSLKPTDDS